MGLSSLRYVVLAAFLAAPTSWAAELERLPRENLLLYHDDAGKTRPVMSTDDWSHRRAEILRGMEEVMGKLPEREKRPPLEIAIEEEIDGGTYIRRLVTYVSEPGCRTPAYLLIPKDALAGKRRAAGVLALHGTNMQIGHGSIVGVGNVRNRGYAPELAERGYVVLAPICIKLIIAGSVQGR